MDKKLLQEEWKSLDFMGYPDYEVSNFGKVKSLNYKRSGKEKILKQGKRKDEYVYVGLCKNGKRKTFTVHRLVALVFLKNDYNLPCVNHKDENKENNHVSNLEWCTYQYNCNYGTLKERQSKVQKKRFKYQKHPMYGKHHTEETKKIISKVNKGKILSKETKNKISEIMKGKNNKSILQYTLNGEFIKEWDSITTASNELGISTTSINNTLKGRSKTAGKYIWKYK